MAGYNTGAMATSKLLKKDPITKGLGLTTLKQWIRVSKVLPSMPETRGRKVNKEFDIELLSQLIYVSAAQAEGEPGATTMHVNSNAIVE